MSEASPKPCAENTQLAYHALQCEAVVFQLGRRVAHIFQFLPERGACDYHEFEKIEGTPLLMRLALP